MKTLNSLRLDKMLANMGVGTRKEVKELLKKKRVTLNGEVIKDGSQHIHPNSDIIKVGDKIITYQKYIYLLLHKPKGVLSATTDRSSKTVIDLLTEEERHFDPHPVGRLDKDTEGLLLLTNDGDLTHKLLSPTKQVEKTYFARVAGVVTTDDIERFQEGVILDDGYQTKPAHLVIKQSGDISEIELTITEGKFHQVKRMFESVGKKVVYLRRIRMGELTLPDDLALGNYRPLTEREMAFCEKIKMNH